MERITTGMLERQIERLNTISGQPLKSYVDRVAQVGNYHLYSAYGSIGVQQMMSLSGGVTTIIHLGTKRGTYNQLVSFINGYEAQKRGVKI